MVTLSAWYTRKELSLRTAILYCGSLLAGAFSGLIAAGITDSMDGYVFPIRISMMRTKLISLLVCVGYERGDGSSLLRCVLDYLIISILILGSTG